MPRRSRLAIPGIPWHIIQRGNNRSEPTYFGQINSNAIRISRMDGVILHPNALTTTSCTSLDKPLVAATFFSAARICIFSAG